MARWTIQNYHKKNAVERQFWSKDGITVTKDEGFRWGIWECESDTKPEIDLNNKEGWEPLSDDVNWEMVEMIDGSWLEWNWPDEISEDERERVETIWDENWFEGLEEDGWINDDTEQWLYGPLILKNEDTGEEFIGEE